MVNRKKAKTNNKKLKCCKNSYHIILAGFRVSFNDKVKFSEDVRKLPDPALKDLVLWIKEKCPEALKESETKLEITVDRIFRPQFN